MTAAASVNRRAHRRPGPRWRPRARDRPCAAGSRGRRVARQCGEYVGQVAHARLERLPLRGREEMDANACEQQTAARRAGRGGRRSRSRARRARCAPARRAYGEQPVSWHGGRGAAPSRRPGSSRSAAIASSATSSSSCSSARAVSARPPAMRSSAAISARRSSATGSGEKRSWLNTSATPAPIECVGQPLDSGFGVGDGDGEDRADRRLRDHDPCAAECARERRRGEDRDGHRAVAAAESGEDEPRRRRSRGSLLASSRSAFRPRSPTDVLSAISAAMGAKNGCS